MTSRRSRLLTIAAVTSAACGSAPAAAAATHHPVSHRKAVVTRQSKHTTPSRANDAATYANWAGYQMRTADPRGARATWTVPIVSWQGRDGYSNQWVGIGGGNATQGQLIQAGTESDNVCVSASKGHCTKSRASYFVWLETYPQRSQERITNLPLSPGDIVDVQVSYQRSSSTASFTLCNVTKNSCVSATRQTSAPRGVAEFVVERPSSAAGRPLALANYGRSRFSSMRVTDSSRTVKAGSLPTTRITMATDHQLATAEGLTKDGDTFTTTFRRPA